MSSASTASQPTWPDPSVRGIEDLANIVKDELGEHGEPADLVAQSMGGVVAVRAAARWPDQVRRLVLVATLGGLDIASLGGADWRQDYRREFPGAQRWVTAHAPGHIDGIESITAPALLVWGDADPISPLPVGQRLATMLPAAVLIPAGPGKAPVTPRCLLCVPAVPVLMAYVVANNRWLCSGIPADTPGHAGDD